MFEKRLELLPQRAEFGLGGHLELRETLGETFSNNFRVLRGKIRGDIVTDDNSRLLRVTKRNELLWVDSLIEKPRRNP